MLVMISTRMISLNDSPLCTDSYTLLMCKPKYLKKILVLVQTLLCERLPIMALNPDLCLFLHYKPTWSFVKIFSSYRFNTGSFDKNMIQLLPNFFLSCFKSSTNHRSIFPSIKDSTTDEIEEQWYMSTLNNPTPFL